jgi:hypothetical protein
MSYIAVRRPRIAWAPAGLAAQAAAAVAVVLVAAALTSFIDDQGLVRGLGGALAVGVMAWFATTRRPQLALALFMVYLGVVDGYVKLSTGVEAVSLLRDVLLYAIVVGLLVRAQVYGRRLTAPPLTAWVGTFVVLVLVQILNPRGGTFVHALAGVREHLEFVPLFFLAFAFLRTTKALRVFVVLLVLIATANGIASWVQFNLTPAQFAAWGPGYADRVLARGDFAYSARVFSDSQGNLRTRPFGLGSESGGGGLIGAMALGGIAALAALVGRKRKRYLLFAIAMAIGAAAGILTSQARSAVVCAIIVVLAYALLTATSRNRARGLLAVAAAGVVALLVVPSILGFAGDTSRFRYAGLSPTSIVHTTNTARAGNLGSIVDTMIKYPLGAGLATVGPAALTVPGGTDLVYEVSAESQFAFSTVETGIAGMLLIVGFTVLILVLGARRLRHESDREARTLLAALIAPIAGMLALYYPAPLTAATPTAPYLWTIGGVVAYWLVARPADRRRAAARPQVT